MNFFQNKKIKLAIKVIISLGFLAYVVLNVNWSDLLGGIQKISWWQVVIYVAILLLGMLISSYKWKLLADYKNFNLSLFEYFKFYLTGTFINNFMPSFVGGDTYKAYQVGRESRRFAEAASTVMVDRITGLVGAMLLSVFFSLLNIKDVLRSDVLIIVNLLVIVSLFSDILIAALKKSDFCKEFIKKILPEKIVYLIKEIYGYGGKKKIIKKAVILAMIYDIVGIALVNYILFWSLGIHINVLDYLSVIFLTSIVASIPITVNNIGIKEWSYIAFFGAMGLQATPVITVAILSRLLQMLVSFFALPIYLKRSKR
jgi:uncharacterized protein (TIRG00374 family)